MPKNLPQRERPARRARSTYSQATAHRGAKVAHKYPAWVTEGRDPPMHIKVELDTARANLNGARLSRVVRPVRRSA